MSEKPSVTTIGILKSFRKFVDGSGDVDITINMGDPGFTDFVRMFDQWETMGLVFVKTPDLNSGELRNHRGEPLTDKQTEEYAKYKQFKRSYTIS